MDRIRKFRCLSEDGKTKKRKWHYYSIANKPELFQLDSWVSYDLDFTGLKDKNNDEIFEADILQYYNEDTKNSSLHQVIWQSAKARFSLFNITGSEKGKFRPMVGKKATFNSSRFEIVGNFYDTPELLK
jgi:uncharacterized phage protein (TIGR01671 family)